MPHLELAHHPERGLKTYNEDLGDRARKTLGGRRWKRRVRQVVEYPRDAAELRSNLHRRRQRAARDVHSRP
jgi:hypothetical protein